MNNNTDSTEAGLRERLQHEIEYILDDDMSGEVRVTYGNGRSEIKQARVMLTEDIMRLVDGYFTAELQKIKGEIEDLYRPSDNDIYLRERNENKPFEVIYLDQAIKIIDKRVSNDK